MGSTWSLKEIRSYQPLQRKLFQAVGGCFILSFDVDPVWPAGGTIVRSFVMNNLRHLEFTSHKNISCFSPAEDFSLKRKKSPHPLIPLIQSEPILTFLNNSF